MSKNVDTSADEVTLPIKRTDGDTLSDRLTDNAYNNILPARYLRKNADGELIEQQEDLFERVAKNIALAEAVFEAEKRDVEIEVSPDQVKPDHPRRDELAEEVFGKGVSVGDDVTTTLREENVNKFAYETVVPELPEEIGDHVEDVADEFQDMMEQLAFMPNCVPPDSLVAAEGGLKPLTDIDPGERVYDDEDGSATVESKFENGEKQVLELETAAGYSVQATPEHYFRVVTDAGEYEWRQVKDLEPDDVLALQKNFLDDRGSTAELQPPAAMDGGTTVAEGDQSTGRPRGSFEAPEQMTPELAEWLGFYVGDGTARESGVRVAFDEQDVDLLEYWTELTESVFDFEPTSRTRNDAACLIGQASRRTLYDFLERNDLLKESSRTATVPRVVLESGRTCIARFLRGLFEADGSVGERAIELYTHSEPLSDAVQKLLLGLGIRSSVTEKRDGYRVSIRKNVCGRRFVERVGFASERKRAEANLFESVSDNATSVKIPNQTPRLQEWFEDSDLGLDAYRDLSQFLIDPDSDHHQEIGVGIFERYAEEYPELWDSPVAEFVERDQFYERVTDIRSVGTMAVEDMQVPRRDTYVVDGFVSHNSPTLMNAGDELQQLSACFVDSPADDITDIHETAKEAAEVFQCLTGDSRVAVDDKGVVSVADVEPGDEIRQRDGDGHTTRRVTETHAYDDAPVRRVETEAGFSLTGTPNHELLVDGEWTRIDETESGQTLSVRLDWLSDTDETSELTTVAAGPQWDGNRTVSNDEILELYAEGHSDYEIADRLDCSASTVQRRRANELGLDPNGQGGRAKGDISFDVDAFDDLYEEGRTDGENAAELGVSAATVGQHRATRSLEANGQAAKTVVQPTELTPDLAELLGMWIGDGSNHEDGIRFHLNREENLEHADRLCRRLFDEGLDWRFEDGCYDAVLHSHEIKRFWLANFGDAKADAPSARVPDQVWAADRDTAAAFLRGLFSTDGGLQKGQYPRLWTASEELVDGVQQLLLGLGVPATRWEIDSDDRDYYNVGPTGEGGLTRFADRVGFTDARDEEMAAALADADLRGPSVGTVRDDNTWEVPVASVEEAGTDTVYDVTVADDPEYVADSVVSHNSGGGMGYAFWKLRPYGDPVGSTGGIASGPITFMRTYDQMCFPPGTRILTPDGQRPIEELDEGDHVIDENGDRQPVVETMERQVDEEIVEITPKRLNRGIRATGEHPFKVARDDGFEWVDAEDLQEDDRLVLGHASSNNDLELGETLEIGQIASGPLVLADGGVTVNREYYGANKGTSPRTFADEVSVDDFATIAGWYLAEGCVVYRRGMPSEVTFTLNSEEREAAAEIQRALDSFGVSSRLDAVEERNTLHVHAEHSSFAQFVDSLFGTGASEKEVPEVLWNAPPETQARVLETLFAGDGKLEKRGKSQRVKLKLANEEIVDFAFQAGLRCGVQFSRHDREPADRKPTYEVSASVSTALGTPLECLFDDIDGDFAARDRTNQAHGREVVAIDEIERVEYDGPVYNAEVADTHTYVAEDLVVHNCETIAQGGARRGAQMGVMRVSHPDVIQFIHAKNKDVSLAHTLRLNDPDDYTHNSFKEALEEARGLIDDEGRVPEHLRNAVEGHLSNFNISVGVTDDFMEAVREGEDFTFTNPRTGEAHVATEQTKELYEMFDLGEYVEVGEELSVPAEEIWERIVEGAHENGEPGVIYLERVNKQHSFDVDEHPDHRILATNPCLVGDTVIQLADGRTRTISELAEADESIEVLSRDGDALVGKTATAFQTGSDVEVVKVTTDSDSSLTATPDHEIRTRDRGWIEAADLSAGDQIVAASVSLATPQGTEYEPTTVTVSSVAEAGRADVYDLSVQETHNFYAIGEGDERFNVHNCGEQPLEEYEACNLGHINLSTLAAEDAPDWRVWSDRHADEYDSREAAIEAFLEEAIDLEEFDRRIEYGTRFLENVVTMSDFPVDEIERKVREMRKIGLGVMGLAQLYVQLGMKYGSEASNEVARQLMTHINHTSKWVSHELAKDRGSFDEWDNSKYADPTEYRDWFEHHTGEDAEEWAEGFPIRNHNTTTIAPTGTTSMVGNTTGGCEPIYNVAYYKNVSGDVQGDEMLVEFDDYFLRVLEANDVDVDAVKDEAKEQMANNEFDGIDGLSTVPDAIGELFVTTGDLSAKEHAAVQCACQAGVDSAISKTVNAPNDSTVEDAKEVFEYIYEHGGKGVTYYRDGTRSKQVLTTRAQNAEFADLDEDEAAEVLTEQIRSIFGGLDEFLADEAVREALETDVEDLLSGGSEEYAEKRPRPDVLQGVSQRVDTGYGKLYVTINEDPETGRPFELFANIGHSGGFTNSFTEALAKVISTALRSGVDPEEIVDELQGTRSPKVAWDKGEQIQSIPDAIGTALRRYLDDEIEKTYPQQKTLEETADEVERTEVEPPETDGGAATGTGGTGTDAGEGPDTGTEATQSLIENGESPECPECGSMALYYSEGCKTCESCGWSEC